MMEKSNIFTKKLSLSKLLMTLFASTLSLSACQNQSKNTLTQTPQKEMSNARQLRILTPDWGIASTLTAMGYPPVATGDVREYPNWSVKPRLPKSIIDLGARYAPNPELMAQLSVDMVVDNDFYQHLRPMYGKTRVVSVKLQGDEPLQPATWQTYADNTLKLGQLVGQPQLAKNYVAQSQKQLSIFGKNFRQRFPTIKKLVIIQFANASQFRNYTDNSLFKPTLDIMGLGLISFGKGNTWGFVDRHLSDLANLPADSCLVIVEPFSPMLRQELESNALWQRLGYAESAPKKRCVMVVPATWIYGGIPSMVGFGESLTMVKINMQPLGISH